MDPIKKIAFLCYEEGLAHNSNAGYSQTEYFSNALKATGTVDVARFAWDDASVDLSQYAMIFPLEVWDYFDKCELWLRFLQTALEKGYNLLNHTVVVQWNTRKLYLQDLARLGVDIVPTLFLSNDNTDLSEYPNAQISQFKDVVEFVNKFDAVILKPSISAGANLTVRVPKGSLQSAETQAIISKIKAVHANVDVMVQPFLSTVTAFGEISLIYVANKFVHAIRKVPKNGDYRVQKMHGASYEAYLPNEGDLAFGEKVIASMKQIMAAKNPQMSPKHVDLLFLYYRVDYIPIDKADADTTGLPVGSQLLMEVEAIEPELFMNVHPPTLDLVTQAVLERLAETNL